MTSVVLPNVSNETCIVSAANSHLERVNDVLKGISKEVGLIALALADNNLSDEATHEFASRVLSYFQPLLQEIRDGGLKESELGMHLKTRLPDPLVFLQIELLLLL
jgi:hypothetical protein